jgi:hypothetical protein
MNNPKLTDKTRPSMKSIGELWKLLSDFTTTCHKDHKYYNDLYPLKLRKLQMESIHMLVNEIEDFHKKFSKEEK